MNKKEDVDSLFRFLSDLMIKNHSYVCGKDDLGKLIRIYERVYRIFLAKHPRNFHLESVRDPFHKEVIEQFQSCVITKPHTEEEDAYTNSQQLQTINQLKRVCRELSHKNDVLTKRLLETQSRVNITSDSDVNSTLLVLDSRFSEHNELDNEYAFQIPPHIYKNVHGIQCVSGCVEIHNLFNVTKRNNTFILKMDGNVTSISIQPGCYGIKEIVSQLDITLSNELGTNEFVFEYNHVINRVFLRNKLNKQFILIKSNILELLGIRIPELDEGSVGKYLHVSEYPPQKQQPLTCALFVRADSHCISNVVSDNHNLNSSSIMVPESHREGVFQFTENTDKWRCPLDEVSRVFIRVNSNHGSYKKIDVSFRLVFRFFKLET